MGVQTQRKRRRRSGATQKQRLISAEREATAVAMRLEDATLKEISEKLGISQAGVHKAIERAIARRIDMGIEQTAELRRKQLTEIMLTIQECWKHRGDLQTIDRLVRLWDRQAKLCGLDEPDKFEHTAAVSVGLKAPVILIPAKDGDETPEEEEPK